MPSPQAISERSLSHLNLQTPSSSLTGLRPSLTRTLVYDMSFISTIVGITQSIWDPGIIMDGKTSPAVPEAWDPQGVVENFWKLPVFLIARYHHQVSGNIGRPQQVE